MVDIPTGAVMFAAITAPKRLARLGIAGYSSRSRCGESTRLRGAGARQIFEEESL